MLTDQPPDRPTSPPTNQRRIRLLFVLGTRPEGIKLAPLIQKAKADPRFEVLVCSTGQHREMLAPILEFFGIVPDDDLQVMKPGQTLIDIVQGTLAGLSELVARRALNAPSGAKLAIVVQGDTTTGFAAGLFGFYSKIAVHHVEAGLRSGDLASPYPEEFNRRALSLATEMHFAPTEASQRNLLGEGISPANVVVTGNTGIDALFNVRDKLAADLEWKTRLGQRFSFLDETKKLVLVTLHRRENFGAPMREAVIALERLSKRKDVQILVSLHLNPNVRSVFAEVLGERALRAEAVTVGAPLVLSEPFDYISFVYLLGRAHVILTDSGGIQEEAPSLGKAVLVARTNTERAEALAAGDSKLMPLDATAITTEVARLLDDEAAYREMAQVRHTFGDGRASERILNALADRANRA